MKIVRIEIEVDDEALREEEPDLESMKEWIHREYGVTVEDWDDVVRVIGEMNYQNGDNGTFVRDTNVTVLPTNASLVESGMTVDYPDLKGNVRFESKEHRGDEE